MSPSAYYSFLLRLWQVGDGGPQWRATLESVESGERRGFASLQALVEFLQSLEKSPPASLTGEDLNIPESGSE